MTPFDGWKLQDITFSKDDGLPKYIAIARAIGSAITEQEFPAGSPLPSQKELAESFGVTVMTVRQAIRILIDRGLVTVEQGKGTYVCAQPYRLPLGALSSFAEQMAASGRELRTTVLGFEPIPVSPIEQRRMSLATPEAFELVRVRYVDGEPLIVQSSLLPRQIAERLDPDELATTSLYQMLKENLGITVDRATETVQATSLDATSAAILHRKAGEPALLSARLTFSNLGMAIVDDRALAAGDSVVISTERRADETGISLVLSEDIPFVTDSSRRFVRHHYTAGQLRSGRRSDAGPRTSRKRTQTRN